MAHPLVQLGPGGDYAVEYRVRGLALQKQRGVGGTLQQQPDTETGGSFASWGQPGGSGSRQPESEKRPARQADRFEHQPALAPVGYQADGSAADASHRQAIFAAAVSWLTGQRRELLSLAARLDTLATNLSTDSLTPPTEIASHEPDPETASHPDPHPRHPLVARLFTDHAGTRRRTRRIQGHGLRTRRGADQKGRARARGEQSPLFAGVA